MKRLGNVLFSMAAPSLIVVAIWGFLQREGSDQLQALPALVVGIGLIISGAFGRSNRRRKLLDAIRRKDQDFV